MGVYKRTGSIKSDVLSLLLHVKDGDEQAFKRLYYLYKPVLLKLICLFVKDGDWAAEILQETFMKL